MSVRRPAPWAALAILAALSSSLVAAARAATIAPAPAGPLRTAIMEPLFWSSSQHLLFARTRTAGAYAVRLVIDWSTVAPNGKARPSGFDPANPNDSRYKWSAIDAAVISATKNGLHPILCIIGAPDWAQRTPAAGEVVKGSGSFEPDAQQYGLFARAAATRYDGSHGLPRVRYWQAWNEPNINYFLSPQRHGAALASPATYRSLVNAFAAAVHAVGADNLVIAGGLGPFTVKTGLGETVGPLPFMRAMLCMSTGLHPHATCSARTDADVWAIHPYTSGNAFHHALNANDVSLGDLSKMRSLLAAAVRAGNLRPTGPLRLWVTELAWDTNPPDTNATPLALQARWTSEALWQCWRNGIDLVTWFMLRDQPFPSQPFQSGLYFLNNTKKPTYTAFRFPFVAYPRGRKTYVWGRTPDSKAHAVAIMHKLGYLGYVKVATLQANRFGIFQGMIPLSARVGFLHAQIRRESSLDFALEAPPDRFVHPFG